MLKPGLISSVLLVALSTAAQQSSSPASQKSANYDTVPVTDANKSNPVKPTPESLARGKRQYGYDCAMCHGQEGNGKGDVAAGMNLKMHDWTNPATLKDRADGELFYIIKNGKADMPPEGDRVKPEQIWDMINFIRSFVKQAAPADKTPADNKTPK
jgi:mono/diheme cytochrome c family protein